MWLKDVDSNIDFFHVCVKNRSRRNTILVLNVGDD